MEEENKTSANEGAQEEPTTQQTDKTAQQTSDGGNTKLFGILGYIFPILFFLPLVMEDMKNNELAQFHANQQLNLLIFWVVINVIAIIPILGWIVAFFGWIFGFVLVVMGIINVSNDNKKPLPLIGGMQLLK